MLAELKTSCPRVERKLDFYGCVRLSVKLPRRHLCLDQKVKSSPRAGRRIAGSNVAHRSALLYKKMVRSVPQRIITEFKTVKVDEKNADVIARSVFDFLKVQSGS